MARRPQPWFREDRGAWFVTINGQRHNLGPDKESAFDEFYRLMRQPQTRRVSGQSLPAVIDVFLDWTKKNRAPDTFEWYRYRLQRFVDCYPDLKTTQLRPFHIQQWVDGFPHLSPNSRRNLIRTIRRCLRWAVQQGHLDENPVPHLEMPRAESRETLLSQKEFERLLTFIRDESFGELLQMIWDTGCRPQEILRVEARHVDLSRRRWVFPTSEAKMKKAPRIVYLPDLAFQITQRLMLVYPQGSLFRNSAGKPWTTCSVNCAFVRVQIRMGREEMRVRNEEISPESIDAFTAQLRKTRSVKGKAVKKTPAELRFEAKKKLTQKRATELAPKYCLYALRHSWSTRALERGVDPLTVAILMGHRDPSTLARVYQHLSHNPENMLEQAKRAVG